MAVDEVAGVHESINSVIEITWAIPAGFAALLIGLAFLPFLLPLPRRTALLFMLAGFIFLGGAVGIEIIGNSVHGDHEFRQHLPGLSRAAEPLAADT